LKKHEKTHRGEFHFVSVKMEETTSVLQKGIKEEPL